jgi:hypothetical protein
VIAIARPSVPLVQQFQFLASPSMRTKRSWATGGGISYDATIEEIDCGVLDMSKKRRAVSNAEIEMTMTDLLQGGLCHT